MLHLEAVTVSFGGITALHALDLAVEAGEVVGIFGANGSGKSSLFNAISGVTPPQAGRIRLEGRDIAAAPIHVVARLGVARTFQTVRLFRHATVLANVLPALGPDSRPRAEAALAGVGLIERQDDMADTLSYFEQRRLELARALAMSPRLLLLDEPTSGLNPAEAEAMAGLIHQLALPGRTVLLIEHRIDLIARLTPRAVLLDQGSKVADGPTTEVLQGETARAVYLRGPRSGAQST